MTEMPRDRWCRDGGLQHHHLSAACDHDLDHRHDDGRSADHDHDVDQHATTAARPITVPPGIVDRDRAHMARVVISGCYALIAVETSPPPCCTGRLHALTGLRSRSERPGHLVLVSLQANDPRWRVSKELGHRWKTHNASHAPAIECSRLRHPRLEPPRDPVGPRQRAVQASGVGTRRHGDTWLLRGRRKLQGDAMSVNMNSDAT
jgi:hypothetical protein